MKLALVTNCIYRTEPEYVKYTDEYKRQYCQKWGIDYLRTSDNIHPENPPAWSKPGIILRSIADYDWMIWMDADAATIGMNVDIAAFLSSAPKKIIMQRDRLNWNSGVFAIPNDSRCIEWLKYIDSHRNDQKYQGGWWEQSAMIDSFKTEKWRDIVWIPPREIGWNNYPKLYGVPEDRNLFESGHWCLHMPGKADSQRVKMFKDRQWLQS